MLSCLPKHKSCYYFRTHSFYLSLSLLTCRYTLCIYRVHTGSVTGLLFAPSGDNLYSSSSNGSLALYDTHSGDDDGGCRVVRVMGNTVAKGERYGPRALTLNEDGSRLAFIGPMEFTVTVLDAHTMEEVNNCYFL